MTVALFAPCYVDQFYPSAAVASLRLLEALGFEVVVPAGAACCGQPMANAGFEGAGRGTSAAYQRAFASYDAIVTPSGSCAVHLQAHVPGAGARTQELCAFLHDTVGVDRVRQLGAQWHATVGVHLGCHGLRMLGLATPTETGPDAEGPPGTVRRDKVSALLAGVGGLEMVALDRPDECCGFGGTFAVAEPAVSVKMGQGRLTDHLEHGAQAVVTTDMSCAMHLEGLARRAGARLPFVHVAQALMMGVEAGEPPVPSGLLT